MVFIAPAGEGALVPGHAPLCPPGTTPAPAVLWTASLARGDPRAGACLLALAGGAGVVQLNMSVPSLHSHNRHPSFPKQLDARTVPLPSAGAPKICWIDGAEALCTTETCAMMYCVHSGDHVKQQAAGRQPTGKLHPWGLLTRQWRRSTGLPAQLGRGWTERQGAETRRRSRRLPSQDAAGRPRARLCDWCASHALYGAPARNTPHLRSWGPVLTGWATAIY